MIALHLSILSLLVATVAAQDNTASNRFIPQDAQIVLRIAAPTQWASQFTNTKIAQVFGGQALAPIMGQFQEGLEEGLAKAKDAGVDPELLDGLFDKYTGDLVIALRIDLEDLPAAIDEDRPPSMAVTIALTPDGSYDLPGLAESMSTFIEEKNDGELRDLVAGDYTLRVSMESEGQMSVPTMIDDHLVMLFATDMERDAPSMLAKDNRGESVGAGKPLYLHIDAEQAVSTLLDFITTKVANDPTPPPFDVPQVLADFGFGCIRYFDFSITADGDQAVLETNLATKSENHGLFGAFLIDQGTPRMLRYLPASGTAFGCQAFDFGAVYSTISTMWSAFEGIAPMSFEDIEFMFENATKVRLREDLIDHIGTEILYLSDYETEQDLDEDDPTAIFAGSCYALSLRDGKAFGESLEKALRSRGLHAARKSDEYQSVKVYRLRLAGVLEVEYAVTDDLLLLALGSDELSRAHLRSILDARANPTAGIPESIAEHADKVPAGWNGVAITPLATVLENLGTMVQTAAPAGLPPEAEMVFNLLGTIGTEMKQVGLDNAVQFSWSSATGIRSVTRL